MCDPEPKEERGNPRGSRGGGDMKEEKESEDRAETTESEESRTESARELSGEREEWRNEMERNGDGGSLADDEEEEEEEASRTKGAQAFTPRVTIVHPGSKPLDLNESSFCWVEPAEKPLGHAEEPQPHEFRHDLPDWRTENPRRCCGCCGDMATLGGGLLAAAVMFPLLVWLGFEFLPFDIPLVSSAPFRLVYTLRCAFFATLPIILGVLVQGVSRLKFGALNPLFEGNRGLREVVVHGNYIRDSLYLFLLYFIQLAIVATYIRQDMLKLVPLLTIIFVFGRLIYWACVVFGSSVRSLGFGLSFLPMLVLVGANLYFVCSSVGQEAVFHVAPPPTTPPPKLRWWG